MSKPLREVKKSTREKIKSDSLSNLIKDRQTEELIIAFSGALGSGTTKVSEYVKEILKNYGYDVEYIKISDLIQNLSSKNPLSQNISELNAPERIERLQTLGNILRDQFGNDVLAQSVITEIGLQREHDRIEKEEKSGTEIDELKSRRHITLVDSLKHPDEYRLLEIVYGNMFYMFGVLCPEHIRINRLVTEKGFEKSDAIALTNRDRGESIKNGQQLLDTLHLSDFFISNIGRNIKSLKNPVARFVNLILGEPDITPTKDEYAMHAAHSASLRSGCMSRQVGASIVNNDGDIIATGRNDVPRCGGGLYGPEDAENDARCIVSGGKCRSDMHKKYIFDKLKNIVSSNIEKHVEPKIDTEQIIFEIDKEISELPELNGLIEFSRAVHAEMDAITSAAKNSYASLKGTTLYCTTFPCHHCARHIVASGISKVYYIEPYEKSLATKLHGDSLDVDSNNYNSDRTKVGIIPFEGVAPKRFTSIFSMRGRKNSGGERLSVDLTEAKPVIAKYLDTHVDYEKKVLQFFQENVKQLQKKP